MKKFLFVPLLGLAIVGLADTASAQFAVPRSDTGIRAPRDNRYDERQSYYDSRRAAYDNGYREGVKEGEKDGRKNEYFSFEDEKTFQRADKGYHRQYGEIERYRQAFRSGYANGYAEGYDRYGRRYDNGRYGNNGRYGTYPRGNGRYENGPVYGGYPGTGRYNNPAFDNGVNDGYEKGVEDARKNRSYDVLRHEWYREGDRHYEGRYGSRDQYKNVYREGFKEGYARGFQEGRYRY